MERGNDNEKVSVIVPVYNVASYLERCVESLLNQTYSDLEIFLVDDGSTDGSGLICDKYANTDKRIIVIHQENAGCSEARNKALELYTGEYLTFVDADDFVELTYIEKLHDTMKEQNADMVICDFDYVDEAGNLMMHSKQRLSEGKHKSEELFYCNVSYAMEVFYMTVMWNKMCRRSVVRNFRFPCKFRNFEDTYWCPYVFMKLREAYAINDVLYHYTCNSKSLTHQTSQNKLDAFRCVSEWKMNYVFTNVNVKETRLMVIIRAEECRRRFFPEDRTWEKELKGRYREEFKKGKYFGLASFIQKIMFRVADISFDLYEIVTATYFRLAEYRLKILMILENKKHS